MSQYATPEIPEENAVFLHCAAHGAAVGAAQQPIDAPPAGPLNPDLQAIINAWPNLPEPTRAGILAMIQEAPARLSGTP